MNSCDVALICKALSDANRIRVLQLLTDGQMCACEILERLQITQPTLSHHMKILCECELVESQKVGKWTHYQINCTVFNKFKSFIETLTCCQNRKSECE